MNAAEVIAHYSQPNNVFNINGTKDDVVLLAQKAKLKAHKTECILIHSNRHVRYDDGTWPAALLPDNLWGEVILSHSELAQRYTTAELCKLMTRCVGKPYHSKEAKEKIAARLWPQLLATAIQGSASAPIERKYGIKVENGHVQRYGVVYDVSGVHSRHVDEKGNFHEGEAPRKVSPQAAVIISELKLLARSLDRDELTEPEVQAHINTLAAKLKTKQDPWRVFQFYRAALIGHGFFTMEKGK